MMTGSYPSFSLFSHGHFYYFLEIRYGQEVSRRRYGSNVIDENVIFSELSRAVGV